MELAGLYDQYADRVRATIYRETRSHDAAEELTHEAFIRLSAKLHTARTPIALLTQIIGGLVKNWYRAQDRRRAVEFPAAEPVEHLTEGLLPSWHDYAFGVRFDHAVRALDEGPRDAFILTTLRGLDQDEAGALLGVDPRTVRRYRKAATDSVREDVI